MGCCIVYGREQEGTLCVLEFGSSRHFMRLAFAPFQPQGWGQHSGYPDVLLLLAEFGMQDPSNLDARAAFASRRSCVLNSMFL